MDGLALICTFEKTLPQETSTKQKATSIKPYTEFFFINAPVRNSLLFLITTHLLVKNRKHREFPLYPVYPQQREKATKYG